MEYREIAIGVKIPILGLGTWGMGGKQTVDRSRDEVELKAIQTGIKLKMTHIDTAEYYGAGHAEEIVGEAIEPFNRKDLFITTKVWHNHLKYNDLIYAMKASLNRLNLDYVDLYLVHWPNPNVPLKETMKAMEHCVNEGYTRFIGVSNFSSSLIAEAQSHLKEHRLVADQVEYSLIDQKPKIELLPYCRRNNLILIAYSPIAKGRLTRKGEKVLDELSEKYGKTRAQVSINWLINQKNVVAIPKASKIEHLKENAGSIGWKMVEEDIIRLERSFV